MTAPAGARTRHLDLRGLKCPLPAMKTGRILAALEPGDVLVVETTDPLAPLDIAHLCRERGHTIEAQEAADGVTRFTIRRGPSAE